MTDRQHGRTTHIDLLLASFAERWIIAPFIAVIIFAVAVMAGEFGAPHLITDSLLVLSAVIGGIGLIALALYIYFVWKLVSDP